jgi:transposase
MTRPISEVCAQIARLYYVEHWKVGTIATQLGVHRDVVVRVLGIHGERPPDAPPRARLVDPYRDFIDETLDRYPRLRATRLHDMVRERGYRGAVRTLRDYVATVRPAPRREVFLRTEPLVGEQAQADWAYVGKVPVTGGVRALWIFVLVLSYSRALWGEFVLDLSVHSLCRSLVRAARAIGGLTRQILFDNPKTIVLERRGDAVRFHPVLLELCAKLHVQPRLCAVRRPQHKGKVERAIRYLRDRFLAARTITRVADGNVQLARFIADVAHQRPHPVLALRTVGDVLADERARLLPLPDPMPDTDLVLPIGVDRQAFVRLDTNRYSVPTHLAERTLTLVADDVSVRVLDGQDCVAQHPRSFDRRQVIELPAHRASLVAERRAAADLKGRDRLCAAAPAFRRLLERWAMTGPSLAIQVTRAIKLLDLYGDDVFAAAVAEVVSRGLRDTGALAVACDRLRRDRHRPVPVDIPLPAHVEDRDVVPHDLEVYDDHDDDDDGSAR